MSALLTVSGLTKTFGGGGWLSSGKPFRAVNGIGFTMERGETLALVGESGCGKSTTARMISRLTEATSGEILFDGIDVRAVRGSDLLKMRRRIQYIFQDPFASLNARMRVGPILEEPLKIHRLGNAEWRRARVRELLGWVGLPEGAASRFPHEFSGGQRQRIGIARALAVEPELIICDEPVSALDVSIQAQVINLLMDLQKELKLSYLFISHDLAVVKHIANRVCVMQAGEIVEEAGVEQLFADPQHDYTRKLLGSVAGQGTGARGTPTGNAALRLDLYQQRLAVRETAVGAGLSADLVISGGPIWTGLQTGFAEAIAMAGGRVVAVGAAADASGWSGAATRRIDLGGRLAVPGFNDPHLHLATLGRSLAELDLRGASFDEMLAKVRAAAEEGTGWIAGRGYDEVVWDGRMPTLGELDAASAGRPMFLRRVCGHQFLANSAALALAGIDAARADPPDGRIVRDARGDATGLLLEGAGQFVSRSMPNEGLSDYVAHTRRALAHLASQGITSVMDAAPGRASYDELLALEHLADNNELPLRVWTCIYGGHGGVLEQAWADGYRFGRQNGNLRYGAAKLFADGSLGARTAAVTEPYIGGGLGDLNYEDVDMAERLRRFDELGYQLAIHAIGNAAIEQVLVAMEALPAGSVARGRHRIEHGGLATLDQRWRMRAAGITLVPQPIFIAAFGDSYSAVVGRDRAAATYPMRDWLDEGFALSASSDAPVCTSDPLASLTAMTTRRTRSGDVLDASQRLDLATALDLQTRAGAWTQFAEQSVGTLAVGMRADIAVLSDNIFELEPEAFAQVRCDLTLGAGRTLFER